MLTFILIGGLVWLGSALLFMVALVLAARRRAPSIVPGEMEEPLLPEAVSPSHRESLAPPKPQGLLPFDEEPAVT
jgi:hypothetical protein